ncbi:hypothetical protein [Streptomyces yangpuensis]|uniref:hypothetical protein n=1 Tax=Streptomyces yangpuensis TaxID=1648182 RepID=UPI000629A677|nr:hypothetical protein [Streptomyces yangpuensis]
MTGRQILAPGDPGPQRALELRGAGALDAQLADLLGGGLPVAPYALQQGFAAVGVVAGSVAALDAIEHKCARRGKTVEITGLNAPSAGLHGRLSGELAAPGLQ